MTRPKLTLADLGDALKHKTTPQDEAPPLKQSYVVNPGPTVKVSPDRWEKMSNGQWIKLIIETRPMHPKRVLRVELYDTDQRTRKATFHRRKVF